jgi:hypothetical protein
MRMPFERLMEYAAGLGDAELHHDGLEELAARVDEPAGRLADAVVAVRVLAVSPAEVRAQTDLVVRQALEKDRGGIASGFSG